MSDEIDAEVPEPEVLAPAPMPLVPAPADAAGELVDVVNAALPHFERMMQQAQETERARITQTAETERQRIAAGSDESERAHEAAKDVRQMIFATVRRRDWSILGVAAAAFVLGLVLIFKDKTEPGTLFATNAVTLVIGYFAGGGRSSGGTNGSA